MSNTAPLSQSYQLDQIQPDTLSSEDIDRILENTDHLHRLSAYRDQIMQLIRSHSKLGLHRGENRLSKPVILEQQKGQTQFDVGGILVWAGSLKAARKKAKKLVKQNYNSINQE